MQSLVAGKMQLPRVTTLTLQRSGATCKAFTGVASARRHIAQRSSVQACATASGMQSVGPLGIMDGSVDGSDVITCYMRADGSLCCERLVPGRYKVVSMPTHVDGRAFCTIDHPEDCVTYCYLNAEGTLVCEGVLDGEYKVTQASEDEIGDMVTAIWAMTTMEEDTDCESDH